MVSDVTKMVGDKYGPPIDDDGLVEIVEHVKSRKPKAGPPEGIGYKAVEIIKIRRQGVVGHNGRAFIVVMVVHHGRVWIIFSARWKRFGTLRGRVGCYGHIRTVQGIVQSLQGFFPAERP